MQNLRNRNIYIIDIGGTKIEYLNINKGQAIIQRYKTPNTGCFKKDMLTIKQHLLENFNWKYVDLVVISFPGLIKDGMVIKWPNKEYWEQNNIKNAFEILFSSKEIYFVEDCNAGALTNNLFFEEDSIYINAGTGIGAGLIINKQLFSGNNGYASELGHTIIDPFSNKQCSCGKKGCLQLYATDKSLSFEENNLEKERDRIMIAGRIMAIGIHNYLTLLDVTSIHLGGSLFKNPLYRKTVLSELFILEHNFLARRLNIVVRPFKNASLTGALLLGCNYNNLDKNDKKLLSSIINKLLINRRCIIN
ncbi:ROK family protein [Bacillus cereus]|uniref:ROK family protein n=1 Tax=Bacillus cereus TaxID=1396 RepID=UPI002EDA2089